MCERCKKRFNHKRRYEEHLSRKISCLIREDDIYDIDDNENKNENHCKICSRSFSRKDTLERHKKTQLHKLLAKKSIKKNNGKIAIKGNNNSNNKVIINNNKNKNYYFISPFNQEEINELTPEEKIKIFSSNENPIVMIIIKTNLNPSTPQYHNVGYTNMNKACGYIFNGNTWQKKEICAIMNDLLNSKRKDLLKIYDEIKEYVSEEQNKNIQIKIDDIGNTVEPKLEHQVRSKRRLLLNLKNKFSNNKHLIIEAMNKSGKPIMEDCETKSNEIKFKEGYTLESVICDMNQKKENMKRIAIKKELALDLLKRINDLDKNEVESLIDTIENTNDIKILNIITRLLNLSFCFGNEINKETIQNKLQKDTEAEKILFG